MHDITEKSQVLVVNSLLNITSATGFNQSGTSNNLISLNVILKLLRYAFKFYPFTGIKKKPFHIQFVEKNYDRFRELDNILILFPLDINESQRN